MGGTGNKSEKPDKDDGKSKKPPSAKEDGVEDGDIATPKHDPCGDDDQPL